MRRVSIQLALMTAAACAVSSAAVTGAFVCPQANSGTAGAAYTAAVAASGTCNTVIVISATGVGTITTANPNPYDGTDDNLVGVLNNSGLPVTIIHLSSANQIFALETSPGDGICSFTPFSSNSQPCNGAAPGASNYAGTASSYTGINAGLTAGDINFSPGVAPNGGTGYFSLEQAPTGTIAILFPITLSKSFNPNPVTAPGTSVLTLTVMNPNAAAATNINFSDTLPAGMTASPGSAATNCSGGAVTVSTTSISANTSLAAGASCTITVTVSTPVAGSYVNTTSTVTSTGLPTGPGATATLVASVPAPSFSKSFSPATIAPGGTSTLTFNITNNDGVPVTGLAFTDPLPAGVTVVSPLVATNTCGGTLTASGGTISLSGGTVGTGGSSPCTITVRVTSTEGIKINTAGTLTSTNAPTVPGATATLLVASPATISKAFSQVSIVPSTTVVLRFNITNPNSVVTLTGVGVTDTLPTGLLVSNNNQASTTCPGGVITAVPGTAVVMLAGATLAPGASCTLSLVVSAGPGELGLLTNISGPVVSNAGPGNVATATLFVGDPFQITYFPNLNVGDSYLNITNSGASGASLNSGTTASITGSICANVYTFSPDEQLVSCCSCPVTPNGLVSLSAKADLVSNTLTPAVPTSIVVKLLATTPVGGSCTNSAAQVGTESLALGLIPFGTKVHNGGSLIGADGNTTGATITETPFTPANLSAGELSRLGNLCNFILANGSGFGVCRSCRLGGLGANAQ